MTWRYLLIVLSVLGLLSACSRVDSISRYGVQATLTDGHSGRAISKIPVHLKVDRSNLDQTSSRRGKISAPCVKFSYWTWLGGPMHGSRSEARIEIDCPGYERRIFTWDRDRSPGQYRERRGVIDLGEVKLQPR
jgi:hypothetical protein